MLITFNQKQVFQHQCLRLFLNFLTESMIGCGSGQLIRIWNWISEKEQLVLGRSPFVCFYLCCILTGVHGAAPAPVRVSCSWSHHRHFPFSFLYLCLQLESWQILLLRLYQCCASNWNPDIQSYVVNYKTKTFKSFTEKQFSLKK